MTKKSITILVLIAITFAANSQLSYYLSNKFWRLKHASIGGRQYNFNENNSNAPTLQFSGGNIRGNGGCNAYHTKFTINGNSLDINQVMSTRMACNDMYLNETDYFRALSQSHTLEYSEGSSEFTLVNSSNDVMIFFAQFARSNTPPPVRKVYQDDNSDNESVSYSRKTRKSKKSRRGKSDDDDEVKMSKKEKKRLALLEKKKGKLSKRERNELKALSRKEDKVEKSKEEKRGGTKGKNKKGKKSKNNDDEDNNKSLKKKSKKGKKDSKVEKSSKKSSKDKKSKKGDEKKDKKKKKKK